MKRLLLFISLCASMALSSSAQAMDLIQELKLGLDECILKTLESTVAEDPSVLGWTPMIAACINDTSPERLTAPRIMNSSLFHIAALYGYVDTVRAFLDAGANIDAQKPGGQTALHEAARVNNAAVVQLLLERGADQYLEDTHGKTPLEVAGDDRPDLGDAAAVVLREFRMHAQQNILA